MNEFSPAWLGGGRKSRILSTVSSYTHDKLLLSNKEIGRVVVKQ